MFPKDSDLPKNPGSLYFGRIAAKLDDVANYIPARISGWLMVAGTVFTGMDTKNAAKIYKRDRRNHASPNSAQTEAAMAGALDVQLAGNAYYFGKLYEKPTIGDAAYISRLALLISSGSTGRIGSPIVGY